MDKKRNILLVGSLREGTGNNTTCERIAHHLRCVDYHVHLHDISTNANLKCANSEYDLAIGIHALHAGKLLIHESIPFILILGGTDVNENNWSEDKIKIMETALSRCVQIVAFHRELADNCVKKWSNIEVASKIQIISPAVFCFAEQSNYSLYESCNINKNNKIFLLPCSLRPVKDPLFLVDCFSRWHHTNKNVTLVIVGPELSEQSEFSAKFHTKIANLPGVQYLPMLAPADLHCVMTQSCAVVNSSRSEGLANALLETLGVPVIARDCPGNCTIISDYETGFTFHTPEEFIAKAEYLLSSPESVKRVIIGGKQLIESQYSLQNERNLYQNLVFNMLKIH